MDANGPLILKYFTIGGTGSDERSTCIKTHSTVQSLHSAFSSACDCVLTLFQSCRTIPRITDSKATYRTVLGSSHGWYVLVSSSAGLQGYSTLTRLSGPLSCKNRGFCARWSLVERLRGAGNRNETFLSHHRELGEPGSCAKSHTSRCQAHLSGPPPFVIFLRSVAR